MRIAASDTDPYDHKIQLKLSLWGSRLEGFDIEVDTLAARFATAPMHGLAVIKRMIRANWTHSLNEELDLRCDARARLWRDYHGGVAAFMEKRPPSFTGR